MLSERVCKALNAYADGETDPRLRQAVDRLLARSAEARDYLEGLRRQRETLRQLPRQRLGPDFAPRVLRSIAERRLSPRRAPVAPRPRRTLPAWVGLVAAASILLLVGAAAFSYFRQTFTEPAGAGWANHTTNRSDSGAEVRPPDPGTQQGGPGDQQPDPQPGPPDPGGAQPVNVAREFVGPPKEFMPRPEDDALVTGPLPDRELFGPRSAAVTLPLVQVLDKLNTSELKQKLQEDNAFRVELPSRDSSRAFERLQAALKARGVTLLVDQDVQVRLKQPTLHTNFVLFTEDLTSEELIKLLEQVVADDKKAEARKKGDGAFLGLVIFRMDRDDRKELADLLGIDVKQVMDPKPLVDPKVPVSDGTANQVVAALTGQGGTPRGTEPSKAAAKAGEERALVLPYNPVRVRPGSAEVKRFLEGRKPLKTGALQILLVVRELGR